MTENGAEQITPAGGESNHTSCQKTPTPPTRSEQAPAADPRDEQTPSVEDETLPVEDDQAQPEDTPTAGAEPQEAEPQEAEDQPAEIQAEDAQPVDAGDTQTVDAEDQPEGVQVQPADVQPDEEEQPAPPEDAQTTPEDAQASTEDESAPTEEPSPPAQRAKTLPVEGVRPLSNEGEHAPAAEGVQTLPPEGEEVLSVEDVKTLSHEDVEALSEQKLTTPADRPYVPPAQDDSVTAFAPEMWELGGWPLGATFNAQKNMTSFAVYAPKATRVAIELYDEEIGADATHRFDAVKGEDGAWRSQLVGVVAGQLYGYRVWGTNWDVDPDWQPGSLAGFISDRDSEGNHFNPNKLLLDPYAREISHVPLSPRILKAGADRGVFATGGGDYHGRVRRSVDSGRFTPKGVVISDNTGTGEAPNRPAQDVTIYEGHIKNLTMHPSAAKLGDLLAGEELFDDVRNLPDELRGTYAGAAYLAPYLKGLGFTTLELLPVHETDSDQVGAVNGTTNFWGYQTIGFFAPNRDYAHDKSPGGPTREFKEMVRTFHEHDVEVYLDVVFNHTAEGGNWDHDIDSAAFTSFGGFATTHYYDLTSDGYIVDGATGSSNQTNFSTRAMCDVVMNSLIYWHDVMGVDGFRFDLATVLGRFPSASDKEDWGGRRRFFNAHPLLREVVDWADDRGIEVIAEAWDLWGYEVGNFPSGWGEWNGRFRDAVRHYLKGDGNTRAFIELFNGDWLHFNDNAGPQKSINFVTAHDGFTMFDLVSFNEPINDQHFPFGPSDGGSPQNNSWDSGGDQALRRTRWRNNWVTLMCARGVPMVVSGDEYGRTQNGNNNPWNLNTIGMWNNWAQLSSNTPTRLPVDPDNPELASYFDVVGECDSAPNVNPMFRFARFTARLRALDVTLRQKTWGSGKLDSDNVSYLYYCPDLSREPGLTDRQLTVLINGAGVGGTDYLVMINMYTSPAVFKVPDSTEISRRDLKWHRLIDTAPWAESVGNCWPPADGDVIEGSYTVEPWSIAVLAAASDQSPVFDYRGFPARRRRRLDAAALAE